MVSCRGLTHASQRVDTYDQFLFNVFMCRDFSSAEIKNAKGCIGNDFDFYVVQPHYILYHYVRALLSHEHHMSRIKSR